MKKIVGVAILAALLLFLIPMGLRQDRQVQEETPVPTQRPHLEHPHRQRRGGNGSEPVPLGRGGGGNARFL